MAQPTISADETLQGLARYHLTAPKLLWCYPRQPMPSKIVGLSDANWAACPVMRKSSECPHLMLRRHPIVAGTTTPAVISLSSAKSEFYAAVQGACRTLGLALMTDLGFRIRAELCTDGTAGKGLASRRGAGQVRHILCQPRGCNKQSYDGKSGSRSKLGRHSQLTSGRRLESQHGKCGNCHTIRMSQECRSSSCGTRKHLTVLRLDEAALRRQGCELPDESAVNHHDHEI